jgi:hypothetical protein
VQAPYDTSSVCLLDALANRCIEMSLLGNTNWQTNGASFVWSAGVVFHPEALFLSSRLAVRDQMPVLSNTGRRRRVVFTTKIPIRSQLAF